MTAAIHRLQTLSFLDCFVVALLAMTTSVFANPIPIQKPTQAVVNTAVQVIDYKQSDILKPLSQSQVQTYKDVMALQDQKKWDEARILIQKIDNPVVIDFIRSRQTGQSFPKPSSKLQGTLADLRYFAKGSKYISEKYKSGQRYELNLVKDEIEKSLKRGAVSSALSYFRNHRVQNYIDPIDKAQILADIASHYLYLKRYDRARATALKAIQASDQAPLAGLGIASLWRMA